MKNGKKVILVTGANKGIGLEIVRQLARLGHDVILTARDKKRGKEAVEKLVEENLTAQFIQLDITDTRSIQTAVEQIKQKVGRVDVLINNAAILLKEDQALLNNTWDVIQTTIETNSMAQLQVARYFQTLFGKGSRLIMTSSGGGSMTDPVGGWSPAYCISKSLLNAITRHLAHEWTGQQISVNAFCPGWVKTDMGGKAAPRSVEQGADTAVWLATSDRISTGKFFRDRQEIPW
jgi:NAD(P)-dependent dehydrogenase (short-subunit alcohol dehydrogenase family)